MVDASVIEQLAVGALGEERAGVIEVGDDQVKTLRSAAASHRLALLEEVGLEAVAADLVPRWRVSVEAFQERLPHFPPVDTLRPMCWPFFH